MDVMHDTWLQILAKARETSEHSAVLAVAATSIIKDEEGQIKWSTVLTGGLTAGLIAAATSLFKDEEGQIKWSTVLTGGLTAGLIAAATSLFSMQQTLTELRTKYEGRAAQVELIPAINERQKFVIEELTAIRSEKAVATSDRFRGADAQRLEERLQRHIDALERRVDEFERGKKR